MFEQASLSDLNHTQNFLIQNVRNILTEEEKEFLISFKGVRRNKIDKSIGLITVISMFLYLQKITSNFSHPLNHSSRNGIYQD